MCGLLAGFGGVWKTWSKLVRDDFTQFGCKNANKNVRAAFKCVGFWINDCGSGVE